MKLSVYFAGELFSAKHLAGNAKLAAAIERQSKGEISCVLPQTLENRTEGPHFIRDNDLETLITADLALFNFDGCEIDSGTVAEFMFAKFADVPALLLRTDFRRGGDQGKDPWNLMLSFYPRTSVCCLDSMAFYKKGLNEGLDPLAASELMLEQIGAKILQELYSLARLEPILPADSAESVYDWITRFPGFHSPETVARVGESLARRRRRTTV